MYEMSVFNRKTIDANTNYEFKFLCLFRPPSIAVHCIVNELIDKTTLNTLTTANHFVIHHQIKRLDRNRLTAFDNFQIGTVV